MVLLSGSARGALSRSGRRTRPRTTRARSEPQTPGLKRAPQRHAHGRALHATQIGLSPQCLHGAPELPGSTCSAPLTPASDSLEVRWMRSASMSGCRHGGHCSLASERRSNHWSSTTRQGVGDLSRLLGDSPVEGQMSSWIRKKSLASAWHWTQMKRRRGPPGSRRDVRRSLPSRRPPQRRDLQAVLVCCLDLTWGV